MIRIIRTKELRRLRAFEGADLLFQVERKMHLKTYSEMDVLNNKINNLKIALKACAQQFRYYEKLHLAKSPPDTEKAETNQTWAELCEDMVIRK